MANLKNQLAKWTPQRRKKNPSGWRAFKQAYDASLSPRKKTIKKINKNIKKAAADGKLTRMEIKAVTKKSKGTIKPKRLIKIIKKSGATTPKMTGKTVKMVVARIKRMNDSGGSGRNNNNGKQ